MAILTLDAYKAALQYGNSIYTVYAGSTGTTGRPADRWTVTVSGKTGQGVAPTSAVVPTATTPGAIGQTNALGQQTIIGANLDADIVGGVAIGAFILCDRLSHQGGLSGTVTTAQTTNLPTAALTRYTSGEGVMIGLSIYTQIGATGTTVSATYTNSGGVGSRVTPLVTFGGTGFNASGRMILLPLQSGDTGVRSVQSVTVTATTGTAGNFGVTLFKPLAFFYCAPSTQDNKDIISGSFLGGLPAVEDDACLFFMQIGAATQILNGQLIFSDN